MSYILLYRDSYVCVKVQVKWISDVICVLVENYMVELGRGCSVVCAFYMWQERLFEATNLNKEFHDF